MEAWLLDLVACPFPGCGGALRLGGDGGARGDDTLRCKRCGAIYPVLGGVPVLVPDPARYLAAHRDAVVASLAEVGRASRPSVRLIDDFASQAGAVEPTRFGDDWVRGEGSVDATPVGGSSASEAFDAFLSAARSEDLLEQVLAMLPAETGVTVEVGSGAGLLSPRLRARAERLVLVDLSLRAALRSKRAAGARRGGDVGAVVGDAEDLPLRTRRVRTIVAANLIDLLDQPGAFLGGATAALTKRGRLLLATPAPELGLATDAEVLSELVHSAGLVPRDVRDGIPWIRAHGPRHFQVYFVQALLAEKS